MTACTPSLLLLVDLQERLMPAIAESEAVVRNADRLAAAARILEVPTYGTEQNPDGIGRTVERLRAYPREVLVKTFFDATREAAFEGFLPTGREIVVAGCEAHVCVLQTTLGLLRRGYRVRLVRDAVGSRRPADREAALERARAHGAELVTTEMVLFEWLETSDHPGFRDVLRIVK